MGKYLLVIPILFFLGCNNPLNSNEKNKKDINQLQQRIDLLETKIYKIDELEKKIKIIQEKQNIIQTTINNQKILSTLASLNKEIRILKNENKVNTFDYIVIHPITLITINKANIYSSYKNGKIIKVWPKQTTFTTYKEKNGYVKVTGYFINNKWVENNQEWWIKKTDTTIKRLEK